MGAKCFYWHGIKILGSLQAWKPFAIPQSAVERAGTDRTLGAINPRSRNFLYEITTRTSLAPQSSLVLGTSLDIGPQGVMNLTFLQWQALMVSLGKTLGPLSWCEDVTEVITPTSVGAPGAYPGTVTINYAVSGFTPAAGMDVLLRNPTSGAGWVGRIGAVGAGTFTVLNCPSAAYLPTTSWRAVLIRFYFPDTLFMGGVEYENETQVDDKWIPQLTTRFKSQAHPVYPAAYTITLG
jgi:hypothetical protein